MKGWVTERIIEPRLSKIEIDKDADSVSNLGDISELENKSFRKATMAMLIGIAVLITLIIPEGSALRSPTGELAAFDAPLMKSIVPLIFIIFIIPGIVYGRASGKFKKSDDIVKAMYETMGTMGSYIFMVLSSCSTLTCRGK